MVRFLQHLSTIGPTWMKGGHEVANGSTSFLEQGFWSVNMHHTSLGSHLEGVIHPVLNEVYGVHRHPGGVSINLDETERELRAVYLLLDIHLEGEEVLNG